MKALKGFLVCTALLVVLILVGTCSSVVVEQRAKKRAEMLAALEAKCAIAPRECAEEIMRLSAALAKEKGKPGFGTGFVVGSLL